MLTNKKRHTSTTPQKTNEYAILNESPIIDTLQETQTSTPKFLAGHASGHVYLH